MSDENVEAQKSYQSTFFSPAEVVVTRYRAARLYIDILVWLGFILGVGFVFLAIVGLSEIIEYRYSSTEADRMAVAAFFVLGLITPLATYVMAQFLKAFIDIADGINEVRKRFEL